MGARKKISLRKSEFAIRLEKEMEARHLNQAYVASRLRISPGTVSGWFTKGALPQPRIREQLAEIFSVHTDWLIHGKEPKLVDAVFVQKQADGGHQTTMAQLKAGSKKQFDEHAAIYGQHILMIPMISWAQAGMATAFEEIPEHWQQKIPAIVTDKSAFAIQLRGDSMEPKFSDGDVAIVLPNKTARNGNLVIANIKEEGFAFKVMTLIGGNPQHIRLTSYNQVYPPMDFEREQFHWIYPVHSVNKLVGDK